MENSFPSLLLLWAFVGCSRIYQPWDCMLYQVKLTVNVISSSAIFLFQLWYMLYDAYMFFSFYVKERKKKRKERKMEIIIQDWNNGDEFDWNVFVLFLDLRIERIPFEQSDGTSILVIHKQILAVLFFRDNVEGTNSFIRLYFFSLHACSSQTMSFVTFLSPMEFLSWWPSQTDLLSKLNFVGNNWSNGKR